jgi:hypothetical protein
MVATAVLPLVHEPPEGELLNVNVPPTQNDPEPVIAVGSGLTVTMLVVIPELSVYVITAVPAETPVTTPLDEPTVAMLTLPLLHVPPPIESLNVVELPAHSVRMPAIGGIGGIEVTTTVAEPAQPVVPDVTV